MFFGFSGGKPVKISAPFKQDFYLISCGALHPKEIPVSIQTYQRQMAELEAFRVQAAVSWSERNHASSEDALAWMEKASALLWLQYLPEADRQSAQSLSKAMTELNANYGAIIATQMMQYRLGWHVTLSEKAAIGSVQLKIESPWFSNHRILCEGNRLKSISGVVISVFETYRDDGVLNVGKLSRQLPAGEPLFLLTESGGYEQGDPGWTMDQTVEFLTQRSNSGKTQLEQIQEFYGAESAPVEVKDEEEIPLVSDLQTSENTPNQTLSTGTDSIESSSTLDAETADLQLIPSS